MDFELLRQSPLAQVADEQGNSARNARDALSTEAFVPEQPNEAAQETAQSPLEAAKSFLERQIKAKPAGTLNDKQKQELKQLEFALLEGDLDTFTTTVRQYSKSPRDLLSLMPALRQDLSQLGVAVEYKSSGLREVEVSFAKAAPSKGDPDIYGFKLIISTNPKVAPTVGPAPFNRFSPEFDWQKANKEKPPALLQALGAFLVQRINKEQVKTPEQTSPRKVRK